MAPRWLLVVSQLLIVVAFLFLSVHWNNIGAPGDAIAMAIVGCFWAFVAGFNLGSTRR